MARIVTHNGVRHSFPDEATDEQITSALDGSDIGTVVGDKRRVSDAQILDMLKAQLADPERDPQATAELQREIQNYEKRIGATPVLHVTPAPRLAQADVRKSEPVVGPLDAQKEREDNFERAQKQFIAAGGVLKPNQTTRQATEEASGFQDPMKTRDAAEMAHIAEGGNVSDITGDSVAYGAAKTGAAIAGGAAGGPMGATGAEALVRMTALAYNLNRAVNAGSIDPDDAYGILLKETAKGARDDAFFNLGVPILGGTAKLLGGIALKIPGAKWLVDRASAAAAKGAQAVGFTPSAGAAAPSARDVKLADRAKLTDDPVEKQAIAELGQRMPPDSVMSPGNVTGRPGLWESNVRKGQPRAFDELDSHMEDAADKLLHETTNPAGQPSAQALGQAIQDTADATQAAVKKRLRPAFEAADQLGVQVDLSEVKGLIKKALLVDERVPGGKLAAAERQQLNSILADLDKNGTRVGPEEALDFISRRKEQLRSTTAEWKPSAAYDTLIGSLTKSADTAYARAAGGAGKGDVVKNLLDAQRDYKEVMGTVYDDAIKSALKKNPEDVGRFLWTNGNVSEPQQLQKMLGIATREGAATGDQAAALSKAVTRGFMQEAIPNIEAAAKWSQTLKENPAKRRTWEELTRAPGGRELRNAIEVIEKASQMAMNTNLVLTGGTGLAQRAASGAGGVTASKVHPGMLAGMISYAAGMKAAATAYTHGDYGVLNQLSQVLRGGMAGTGQSRATQAALAKLAQYAADNGFSLDAEEE